MEKGRNLSDIHRKCERIYSAPGVIKLSVTSQTAKDPYLSLLKE